MKDTRDLGIGIPREFTPEPLHSWKLFIESEGLGVDGLRADVNDLVLHTMTMAKKLVDWADAPSRTLYLHGVPGSGKTYAGIALLRYMYRPQKWMRYLEASKITDLGKQRGSAYLQDTYGACDILMVDDLGVAQPADWEQRYTHDLFDFRCQKLQLPTIVTSNLSKEQLSRVVTPRVTSRLVGLEVEFMTADLRN